MLRGSFDAEGAEEEALSKAELERMEKQSRREEVEREYGTRARLYLAFDSARERDAAMKLAATEHTFNELLINEEGEPGVDSYRKYLGHDDGMVMEFAHHTPQLEEKLRDYFGKNGYRIKEFHETMKGPEDKDWKKAA